jgi:hypothetical protein
MKTTDDFKKVIAKHLEEFGSDDPIFAEKLKNEKKSIDKCITYILNQVQKSGVNGFEDSEIFGMAIHYHDEENIEAGKEVDCKVVTNHRIELTKEEIEEAKKSAMDFVIAEERTRIKKRATPKKTDSEKVVQSSLF